MTLMSSADCSKLKTKYFLNVYYFVVVMFNFPYCAYVNVFNSHYN